MRIAVGGMIASGKSSLSTELAQIYNLDLIEEFDKNDDVFETLLKWLYEGRPNVEMLLQIYFIHNQWLKHKEYDDHYVVDRDVIEHWIFAQTNLRKHPEVLNMYNGLFHAYMNSIKLPDAYIILDMKWQDFEDRVMKRGRPQEIENFEKNKEYFFGLWYNYVNLLVAQCVIFNIPYIIIDTHKKTQEDIVHEATTRLKKELNIDVI